MLLIFAVIIQLLCFGHLFIYIFRFVLENVIRDIKKYSLRKRFVSFGTVRIDLSIVLILKHMGNVVGTKQIDRLVRKDFQIEMNYDHRTCLRKVELFRWK